AGPDVTLFVPCYNEEVNIAATLATILEACRRVACSYEIIVVDDASTDRSAEIVSNFQAKHPAAPIGLICQTVNHGLARNFSEAAAWGKGKYYRIVCGDNVEPVETQVAILSRMYHADLVIPYPVEVLNKHWLRRLLSRAYTVLANFAS